ncbi:hypothetical protein SH1V18_33830 [Vallitalea longa]|uniref:Uncharacterized protein n=1 Tax=Vallitalea longa TaxID=2936439 RepID=A0A9W6DGY0_9FIRM|nr:hypothetical protein [Vallitalea longa]GKX30903.1 hypothetical protein SH1V18_33830 [Vallitalea longa]
MGCNISTCCGIGNAVIGGCKCSQQYGYTDRTITITTAGTFNLWSALDLPNISGTVVIQPEAPLPGATFVVINNAIFLPELGNIFTASIDLLEDVSVITVTGTTELCVSIIANGFECC